MTPLLTWIFLIVAAIMLFLHGLASFSEEVARIGGERLRTRLHKLTHTDLYGALTGAISTALVQFSSAVTSMAAGLAHSPMLADWHEFLDSPIVALLFAALLTALVQSSSGVTGLAVLSVQQSHIAPEVAVWLIAGANIGTTSTALLASTALDTISRKLALLNTCLNVLGVLLFATLLQPIIGMILTLNIVADQQIALVHTTFNLATATVALIILPHIWPALNRWLNREP